MENLCGFLCGGNCEVSMPGDFQTLQDAYVSLVSMHGKLEFSFLDFCDAVQEKKCQCSPNCVSNAFRDEVYNYLKNRIKKNGVPVTLQGLVPGQLLYLKDDKIKIEVDGCSGHFSIYTPAMRFKCSCWLKKLLPAAHKSKDVIFVGVKYNINETDYFVVIDIIF